MLLMRIWIALLLCLGLACQGEISADKDAGEKPDAEDAGDPGGDEAGGDDGGVVGDDGGGDDAGGADDSFSGTTVTVTDTIVASGLKKLGINVGSRSRWGAAQIKKNLISNPGFEAGEYGTVFLASASSTGNKFVDAFANSAQAPGFWNGADFEIVYGPAAGRSGTVLDFTHEMGHYAFTLDSTGVAPQEYDVMLVRTQRGGIGGDTAIADTTTTCPNSPGTQSLHLVHNADPFNFYMDTAWRDGDRASGKMLLVKGNWRLEFWAKGRSDGHQIRARFFRENEADFIDETITLTTAWQQYGFDVNVPDGTDPDRAYTDAEYHPALGFSISVLSGGAEAWIDDLKLWCTDDGNPTVFTDAYVDRLKELQPGILRDWSNQLGCTLDNQLAVPWARRTCGFRPDRDTAGAYAYSLHEFLELCREVGAEPWYVIPPTFSPDDLTNLIEYLAANADGAHPYADLRSSLGMAGTWTAVFDKIHLELGNEMWGAADGGDPFSGASLRGGVRLGAVSHDRYTHVRTSATFDPQKINLVIGGQAGYAGRQQEIEQNSSNHDLIALAPYFGILDTWSNDEEIFYPLFARAVEDVSTGRVKQSQDFIDAEGQGTSISVYEINFHTTSGPAPIDVRNDYLTGAAGALALPLYMLLYQRNLDIVDQCAFSSLQFAYRMQSGEHARLWGMLRDLVTGRKRPTWLGVELCNRAILQQAVLTTQSGDNPGWTQQPINGVEQATNVTYIQSFAFKDGPARSVILMNLSLTDTHPVRLNLPAAPQPQATWHKITPASIHDDNEDSETVVIETVQIDDFKDGHTLDLPPHSIHAIVFTNQ
jgi:alpha-L-arabinofuranosidase